MNGLGLRRLPRIASVAACVALATAATAAPPRCGDWLAEAGVRPASLQFVGCGAARSAQLRTLEATYRVQGARASAIEAVLVRRTRMSPLRFACCGWEPDPRRKHRLGSLRLNGETLQVSMGSGETAVHRRADWARIPWFEVTVTRFVDLP